MDKKDLTNLTNKVYKLTLLFPKKDPLRYKIREKANDILAGFVGWENLYSPNPGELLDVGEKKWRELLFSLEKDLDIVNSYFEIAKWQNWVNYFDILEVQEEYDKIKGGLKEEIGKLKRNNKEGEELKEVEIHPVKSSKGGILPKAKLFNRVKEKKPLKEELEPRKEEIIRILGKVNRIQVGEVSELLPHVSKRTLRRDFQKLVEKGLVERTGDKNNTFYRLKIRER